MAIFTVDTTPKDLVGANSARQNIYIRNNSTGGQKVYVSNTLSSGLAVTNANYVLAAGDWISFNVKDDGDDLRQPWSAISSGAGASVVVSEMASTRKQLAEEAKNP